MTSFVQSLNPGEVGCLSGGPFVEDVTIREGGTPGFPVELRSVPGQVVTLRGRLWIADSANDVVIRGLRLEGPPFTHALPSPSVEGDRVRFVGNDVSNGDTSICFNIGSHTYGIARDVVIERNRIHNCGVRPPTNHHHGIFVVAATGTVIRDNYIYDNADKGIVLWPDAQGTLIEHNVVDGNVTGIHLGGDEVHASSNTLIRQNIITFQRERYGIETLWPGPQPIGNRAEGNCFWGNARGSLVWDLSGIEVSGSIEADPLYVNREAKDFRLQPGSPCAGKGPR